MAILENKVAEGGNRSGLFHLFTFNSIYVKDSYVFSFKNRIDFICFSFGYTWILLIINSYEKDHDEHIM